MRRSPLRRLEDRAPLGAERFELGLRERGARLDVVSVVLADLGDDAGPDGRPRAANELTMTIWDPVSKQPQLKTAAVKVEKVA